MISSLAQEIAKWIAEHDGRRLKSIYVPQAALDACVEEGRSMALIVDRKYKGTGLRIRGILVLVLVLVLVDPTLTIGKIDP